MKTAIIIYLQLNEYTKRKQLLAYLKMQGYKINDRELRSTIEELIEQDGHGILSCSKGYKLIASAKEYQGAIDYISSYIYALLKRRKALKRNWIRQTAKLIPTI